MCWISKEKPTAQIAESNITVCKLAVMHDDKICSMFYHFQYELNQTYKLDSQLTIREDDPDLYLDNKPRYVIDEGFHSWTKMPTILQTTPPDSDITIIKIKCTAGIYYCDDKHVVLICTIPQGSTYYVNNLGEYVSDTIKINKAVPLSSDLLHSNKYLSNNYISFGE